MSNPHARCEVRFPDLRALSIAIGQHSGWDSYASPHVHLHEATRTDEVQMGVRTVQVLDSGEDVPELLRREWELDETGKSRMC